MSTVSTIPVTGWVSTRTHCGASAAKARASSMPIGPYPASIAGSGFAPSTADLPSRDRTGMTTDTSARMPIPAACGASGPPLGCPVSSSSQARSVRI